VIFQSGEEPFFSDDILKQYLADAVYEYQKIIPLTDIADIALVADQSEYDWPENAIDIVPISFGVDSRGLYAFATTELTHNLIDQYSNSFLTNNFQSPANITRTDIFNAFNSKKLQGNIEVDYSLQKIVITPTPQEARTIKIIYKKAYPITDGTDGAVSYDDILDIHFRPLMFLIESFCYNALSDAFMANASKVGNRDYRSENKAEFFLKKAKMCEQRFRKGFNQSAVGRT